MTEEEVQMALSKVDASGEVSGPAGGGPQGSKPNDPGLRTLPTKPYCPLSVHTFPSEAAGCGKGAKTFRLGPESGHQQAQALLPLSSRVVDGGSS